MNENIIETADEKLEIGRWGMAWQQFITENYLSEAAELQATDRWDELALEIDREAWDLRELLRKQYAKSNPRPTTFVEIVKRENTCGFYVDHEIV